jgi:probable O-glycosylation ligase (exosortase A-associated)
MRDLLVLIVLLGMAPFALVRPELAMLVWSWVSLMHPHRLTFGLLQGAHLDMVAALVSIGGWLFSRDKLKDFQVNPTFVLIIVLGIWVSISNAFAIGNIPKAELLWDRTIKTLIWALALQLVVTRKARLHALIWIMVLSVGYFGVKGGGFVLTSGGGARVYGPASTMIEDNNDIGVALLIALPLFEYLRRQSDLAIIRTIVVAAMVLNVIAVIGTYSRGAFIGLAALAVFFWWHSRQKLVTSVAFIIIAIPIFHFMPSEWFDRMNTIETYDQDASARGRLDAWTFAINVANARPLVGGGQGVFYSPDLWKTYNPGRMWRAPHSIFFEVLGSIGWIGLLIYLSLAAVGWMNTRWVIKQARSRPDLRWAYDMATAIRLSFIGFWTAGAFVNLGFYDFYFALLGIVAVLRFTIEKQLATAAAAQKAPAKRGRSGVGRPAPA